MYEFYYTEENFLIILEKLFDINKLNNLKKEYHYLVNQDKSRDQISLMKKKYGVAIDEVRKSIDYYQIWNDEKILNKEIFNKYKYIMYPPMVRTIKNELSFVDWHQDEAYMKMSKVRQKNIITCFIPLEDDLINKPNLQFIENKVTVEINHKDKKTLVNSVYIDEIIKGKMINPIINMGGCYIFGQKVIHRTFSKNKNFEPRTSLEFRITNEESLIKNKDYYNLHKKIWVKT